MVELHAEEQDILDHTYEALREYGLDPSLLADNSIRVFDLQDEGFSLRLVVVPDMEE